MFDEDDLLMRAESVQDLKITNCPSESTSQRLLHNMIVPLRIEELVSKHFMTVLNNNKNDVLLNIFIIGYECDNGVRACGGRSGTELGPSVFRKLLQEENQKAFDDLARQLKKNQAVIYDLGDVKKYQLSKFM